MRSTEAIIAVVVDTCATIAKSASLSNTCIALIRFLIQSNDDELFSSILATHSGIQPLESGRKKQRPAWPL